jgi:hypothetical protein
MKHLPFSLLLVLACPLLACTSEAKQATEVLLEIDAEPGVRARLAKLTIDIRGGAADDAYADYTGEPSSKLDAPTLPLQVALVPRGGEASRRYQVTVEALAADGSFIAQARVRSGYVAGSIRFARLVLEDACIGVDQCSGSDAAPLTCRAGSCSDPAADVRDFSSDRDAPSLIVPLPPDTEASDGGDREGDAARPTQDGGGGSADGGSADAGRTDAGDGGSAQGTCKLGSSKLACKLGM